MDRAEYIKLDKSWVIFTLLLLVMAEIFTAVRSNIVICLFGVSAM